MDGKMLARIAAIVFVAVAVTAVTIEMTREENPVAALAAPAFQAPPDPLRQSQRRCQQMGEAAAEDLDCLRTWSDTRDRFLGRAPADAPVNEGH